MEQNKNNEYATKTLIKRFLPYFKPYYKTLYVDLFCAALTTVCEIVLPLIIRKITNTALEDVTLLTVRMVVGLALVYFVLRIIDALANYYMADTGHIMGAKIETDMRRDAYAHLQQLSNTYFNNTKVGQIMGRITNDLFEVTEFAHHCPEEFFIAGIDRKSTRQNCDFLCDFITDSFAAYFNDFCVCTNYDNCVQND